MNEIHCYSIHDAAVAAFATPFFAATDIAAVRVLTGLVNDPNSTFSIQPSDFTLFCVGVFNIRTGTFTADELRRVRNGLELVRQEELFPDKSNGQGELSIDHNTGDIRHG